VLLRALATTVALAGALVVPTGTSATANASANQSANQSLPPSSATSPTSTIVIATRTGRYVTAPACSGCTIEYGDLGARIVVPAGQTRNILGRVAVAGATTLTAMAVRVLCSPSSSGSGPFYKVVTAENVLAKTSDVLIARALFTAPATGSLTCTLQAGWINHDSVDKTGSINVVAATYLKDLTKAGLATTGQSWGTQPRVLVNKSAYTPAATFTAPSGASSITVVGDVAVTVCYSMHGNVPRYDCGTDKSARTLGSFARVGTQLVVQQLQADGSVCAVDAPPLLGTTITIKRHHYKVLATRTVAINHACTSRMFRAFERVTVDAGGNSVEIEGGHAYASANVSGNQTVTFMYAN
jgi:hypothetical protein